MRLINSLILKTLEPSLDALRLKLVASLMTHSSAVNYTSFGLETLSRAVRIYRLKLPQVLLTYLTSPVQHVPLTNMRIPPEPARLVLQQKTMQLELSHGTTMSVPHASVQFAHSVIQTAKTIVMHVRQTQRSRTEAQVQVHVYVTMAATTTLLVTVIHVMEIV